MTQEWLYQYHHQASHKQPRWKDTASEICHELRIQIWQQNQCLVVSIRMAQGMNYCQYYVNTSHTWNLSNCTWKRASIGQHWQRRCVESYHLTSNTEVTLGAVSWCITADHTSKLRFHTSQFQNMTVLSLSDHYFPFLILQCGNRLCRIVKFG